MLPGLVLLTRFYPSLIHEQFDGVKIDSTRPSSAELKARTTIVSQRQLSASISMITQYTTCTTPDPVAIQGTMRFYVTYLRDTAPNPDKVRAVFFVLQNGFNHTVGVDIINHLVNGGTNQWYTNNSFVLTTPAQNGTQQAGNWQNSVPAGQNTEEGRGSLPARVLNPNDRTGNKWTVHRPQWNGDVSALGNDDPLAVATYSPYNQPWWTPITNNGPYFLAYYHSQGHYATCDGWYPA